MADSEVDIAEVTKILKDAILDPSKEKIDGFITWSLEKYVNEENLTYAIENDLDIITLALNHYGLSHSKAITPLFRLAMKMYWTEAETYLTHVEKAFSILTRKPEIKKILDTEKGRSYLNRCCKQTYSRLYNFIWEDGQI